jgi:Cyclic nucleotide-binding domain/Pyridine nucleotide-disulphide oxidoreductase
VCRGCKDLSSSTPIPSSRPIPPDPRSPPSTLRSRRTEARRVLADEHVTGLELIEGGSIDAELCLIATGIVPNAGLAEAAGLDVAVGITVDDGMHTSDPHIFAVGDVVDHKGRRYGLWPASVEQAQVAATAMVGGEAAYRVAAQPARLKVPGIDLLSIGVVEAGGGESRTVAVSAYGTRRYRKLVLEDGRLRARSSSAARSCSTTSLGPSRAGSTSAPTSTRSSTASGKPCRAGWRVRHSQLRGIPRTEASRDGSRRRMTASDGERTHRGFLADLHEADLAVVLEYTQARLYEPGEFAVRRGDVDRSFFVIARGSFEVLVPSDQGPRRVRLLEPGDLFGEVGFFDGLPRSADVVALDDAEALVLTQAAFQRLRLMHPRLALRFVLDLGRILGERFRASDAIAGPVHR